MKEARLFLKFREREDVTYAELAAMVSRAHGGRVLDASQVSKYEKGQTSPPTDVLLAYAKVCGVDPGWLTYGADSAAPAPPLAGAAPVSYARPPGRVGALRRAAGGKGRGAGR